MSVEHADLDALNDPTIDFFILADRAEAVNGKLYLMGGGWSETVVPDISQPAPLSFALGVLVPWNATNQQHTVRITIEDLDRRCPVPFELEAGFIAGRPASTRTGAVQRVMLASSGVPVKYPGPGTYQVAVRLSTGHERRVEFQVRSTAIPPASIPPPASSL
jgi:hypothetical protein